MVESHLLQVLHVLDTAHLLAYDHPVEVDVAVLDGVFGAIFNILALCSLLFFFFFLLGGALFDEVAYLLFCVMYVDELAHRQELLAVLAELLDVNVEEWYL